MANLARRRAYFAPVALEDRDSTGRQHVEASRAAASAGRIDRGDASAPAIAPSTIGRGLPGLRHLHLASMLTRIAGVARRSQPLVETGTRACSINPPRAGRVPTASSGSRRANGLCRVRAAIRTCAHAALVAALLGATCRDERQFSTCRLIDVGRSRPKHAAIRGCIDPGWTHRSFIIETRMLPATAGGDPRRSR